jgi:hypothetical protein
MSYFTRKTFNEAYGQHPLDPQPSGTLQFMRRRRAGPWGGSFIETGLNVVSLGAFGTAWSAGWGLMSAPFEAGRAVVQTARFLERLGEGGPDFAGPVVDTRMAYTMRRAALNALHNSAYSLRGAIGNEANLMHS